MRGMNEVMNDTLHVVEKLKPSLPEFHTRRMKHDFVKRYSNLNLNTFSMPYMLNSL